MDLRVIREGGRGVRDVQVHMMKVRRLDLLRPCNRAKAQQHCAKAYRNSSEHWLYAPDF